MAPPAVRDREAVPLGVPLGLAVGEGVAPPAVRDREAVGEGVAPPAVGDREAVPLLLGVRLEVPDLEGVGLRVAVAVVDAIADTSGKHQARKKRRVACEPGLRSMSRPAASACEGAKCRRAASPARALAQELPPALPPSPPPPLAGPSAAASAAAARWEGRGGARRAAAAAGPAVHAPAPSHAPAAPLQAAARAQRRAAGARGWALGG